MHWCPLQDLLLWKAAGEAEAATICGTHSPSIIPTDPLLASLRAGASDLFSLLGPFRGQAHKEIEEPASRNRLSEHLCYILANCSPWLSFPPVFSLWKHDVYHTEDYNSNLNLKMCSCQCCACLKSILWDSLSLSLFFLLWVLGM